MKKIVATSKAIFQAYLESKNINDETVESLKNSAFISINNTEAVGDTPPPFLQKHPNVCTLHFDDVVNQVPIIGKDTYAEPLTNIQALVIIKFLKDNEDKEAFLIHCTAGVSRSVAVAEYLNEFYGQEIFNKEPLSTTQKFIIDELRKAKIAYDILFPPIQNLTKTIYPNDGE